MTSNEAQTTVTTMASHFSIEQPNPFDFSAPLEWTKWIRRFERFRIASALNKKPEAEQVNFLVYSMGEKADEIFSSFNLGTDEAITYNTVIDRYNKHFIPKVNVIFERSQFNTRVQQNGESVEQFVIALHQLAERCNYEKFGNELKDELIRDRLVIGLLDKTIREKLQLEDELTLEKAVRIARQAENIKIQNDEDKLSIDRIQQRNSWRNKTKMAGNLHNSNVKQSVRLSNYNNNKRRCYRCGSDTIHTGNKCPARNSTCNICNKIGHWSIVCCSKTVQNISQQESSDDDFEQNELFIGNIDIIDGIKPWKRTISVNGNLIEFKIDTGADVCAVPPNIGRNFEFVQSSIKLFGPNKTPLNVIGKFKARLQYKNNTAIQQLYIVENLQNALLGRQAISELKIIQFIDETELHPSFGQLDPYKEFPKLWSGLGTIPGEYYIEIEDTQNAFAITTPRKIPIALRKSVEEEIQRMISLNVIAPIDAPTSWCSPMHCVYKKDGGVRICVDYTNLNKFVKREWHPIPGVDDTLARLTGAKYFSKLDANSGFWQIPIAKETQHLTTFMTPFGRYVFLRLPFGITSASEVFQKRMQNILQGLEGTVFHLDDIFVFGSTPQEHNIRLQRVLTKLENCGMTLNKAKSKFFVQDITFLGHQISDKGISIAPERIAAITKMPAPTNTKELLRFLGMVNFIGRSIPNRTLICKPLNDLLKKDAEWIWDNAQQNAFINIKNIITNLPALAIFDPNKQTTISADSSSYGIGACLFQRQENGENRPVAYVSRTLTDSERRYANIEREALGITWACTKLSDYILGTKILIETDHKPLVSIFNNKYLDDLSPVLQRLKIKMFRFSYNTFYTPGKQLITADTLSRSPIPYSDEDIQQFDEEVKFHVQTIINNLSFSDVKLAEVFKCQQEDDCCKNLLSYTTFGWPKRTEITTELQKFWQHKDEITSYNNLLMLNTRILIPSKMQPEILRYLHEGHFGVSKCQARANHLVWWPGISTDIRNMVKRCINCIQERNNHAEPLMPSQFPSRPWEKVGIDLFKIHNHWFVTLVDYYSRYIEMMELTTLKTTAVIEFMKSIFARHGIPEKVHSDNGPQFKLIDKSEFNKFSKEYGFQHITSSPMYAQSNGMAEAAVKIAKNRIKKGGDLHRALLAYRSTPLSCGFSPAELLFSRKIRTTVPTFQNLFQPLNLPREEIAKKEEANRMHQKQNYDKRHNAKELTKLHKNQPVWIVDKREFGKVIDKSKEPRSYIVQTSKSKLRRNRFHLIPTDDAVDSNEQNLNTNETSSTTTTIQEDDTNPARTSRYGRTIKQPDYYRA